jgi:hypothetical protein
MGETARAQESSGQPSDLRQMLVDDVCNRRLRMSALLDYFGPTTSTSVAR